MWPAPCASRQKTSLRAGFCKCLEVVGAVVVPSSQAARDAGADAPKAFANNLADLLQDLNRAPRLAA